MSIAFPLMNVDDIEFDKLNPRLPSAVRGGSASEIVNYLALKTRLEDLMASIGENGFFEGEAIVVVRDESGKVIVLEGNRRLAALKLLRNPSLVGRKKFEAIVNQATHKPEVIPVYEVSSRSEAWQYIGFRHISGVQRWDPLAKARYLKLLFDQTSSECDVELRYREVAREIGSKVNTIKRNLDALAAYQIIEQETFFDIDDLDEETFQFGTFYTAIGNTNIARFIGLKGENSETVNEPILDSNCINTEHLQDITEWMFKKNPDGGTVLGESRNIPDLGETIANTEGLSALRRGLPLLSAIEATGSGRRTFLKDMARAIDHLKQANRNLHAVSDSDEEAVRDVHEADQVLRITKDHLRKK